MTLSVPSIREAVEQLKELNVKPKGGYYIAYVPLTPYTEQKFADFRWYGINTKDDWLTVFCFGFDEGPEYDPTRDLCD